MPRVFGGVALRCLRSVLVPLKVVQDEMHYIELPMNKLSLHVTDATLFATGCKF